MKNGVMMQAFHWESPADGEFYNHFAGMVPYLASLGITAIWLPPAHKGTSDNDVGYGSYDYWDLGEFDQKGTVRTKYGTREELENLIKVIHDNGMEVYADMVFNHKGGADETEVFQAVMVDQNDRTKDVSEPRDIEAWTKFTFPGREGKYSDFIWDHTHFTGVDFDFRTDTKAIYRIMGENKYWSNETDDEKGNFDFLMNADIDHAHPDVEGELIRVADFMINELGYDGFRYDALKHISFDFIDHLSEHIIERHPNFYFVGEYWNNDDNTIQHYLHETNYNVDLFDVPLHFNFMTASQQDEYDIRQVFDDTLVQDRDVSAVTFVDNHDSQPGQSLASWVDNWFKSIAYSIILLRPQGYPCIFRGDWDGIGSMGYEGINADLKKMLYLRMHCLGDHQDDYWVTPTKIGWVNYGQGEESSPMVVLISTGDMDHERMFVGEEFEGQMFINWANPSEEIIIDDGGFGEFTVGPGSVSWWTTEYMFDKYQEEFGERED